MGRNREIIKVKKNSDGDITDVMLDNGEIVPINHAILMVKDGLIEDFAVKRGKSGGEFLVHDPNDMFEDNLNHYPTFR